MDVRGEGIGGRRILERGRNSRKIHSLDGGSVLDGAVPEHHDDSTADVVAVVLTVGLIDALLLVL